MDDVRGGVRRDRRAPFLGGEGVAAGAGEGGAYRGVVQADLGEHGRAGGPRHGLALGDQQDRPGVGTGEGDPLGRMGAVHRKVRRTGLQHRQHRDQHPLRARQRHGDHPLRTGAAGDQQPGQAVGLGVEFGVGQGGARTTDRGRRRRPSGLRLEAQRYRIQGLGAGRPGVGGPGPLLRGQDVDVPDRQGRVRGHRAQEPDQPVAQRDGARLVEQVHAVAHGALDTGRFARR